MKLDTEDLKKLFGFSQSNKVSKLIHSLISSKDDSKLVEIYRDGKRRKVNCDSLYIKTRFINRVENKLPKNFLPLYHLNGLDVAKGITPIVPQQYVEMDLNDNLPVLQPKDFNFQYNNHPVSIPYIVGKDLERLITAIDIDSDGHLLGNYGRLAREWIDIPEEISLDTEPFVIKEDITTDKVIQILRFRKEILPWTNFRIYNLDNGKWYCDIAFIDLILDKIPAGTRMKIRSSSAVNELSRRYTTRFLKSSFDLNVFYQSDPIHS